MSQDFKAVDLFNCIKCEYQQQISVLTTLKQEVTRTESLDQGQKSSLRIQIESILIDINEEIFAISEELASAFQMTKSEQNSRELLHRAQEFEQKKVRLMKKIIISIDNNPSTQIVKRELEVLSPQKNESTVMSIIRKYSNSQERISNKSPLRQQFLKNKESVETFGTAIISPELKSRKKSPTPLRNRANIETPEYQRRSHSRNSRNSKSSKIADNRSSRKSISKQSLSTKMALNEIYSLKKPNKQKRNIPKLLPKFSGCGPGGTNSSLMVLNRDKSDATLTMDQRKSEPMNISLKKQNSQQDLNRRQILQQNDKSLKKARQETYKNWSRPQTNLSKQRSTSILSNYDDRHNQSMQATFEKSFSKKENSKEEQTSYFAEKNQSEAVLQFSKDFDLMRKKFGEMHSQMGEYQSSIGALMKEVKQLKDENLKLNTDIRVIRNEHSEMAHTVYKLEQKNLSLVKENQGLKDQLGRVNRSRDFARDLPSSIDLPRHRTFQQIIESPFNSALNRKQVNEGTGDFPTIMNSVDQVQSPKRMPTFQSPQTEANEEELSDWVLQRLQGLKAQ